LFFEPRAPHDIRERGPKYVADWPLTRHDAWIGGAAWRDAESSIPAMTAQSRQTGALTEIVFPAAKLAHLALIDMSYAQIAKKGFCTTE
jgi:hypothetical protein